MRQILCITVVKNRAFPECVQPYDLNDRICLIIIIFHMDLLFSGKKPILVESKGLRKIAVVMV